MRQNFKLKNLMQIHILNLKTLTTKDQTHKKVNTTTQIIRAKPANKAIKVLN